MSEYRHVSHRFGPVYDARCRVLILGSFPSVKSLAQNFYYANPRNRFWAIVQACTGETFVGTTNAEKEHALLRAHIAIWDVVESCDVKGSSDASITNVVPVAIKTITDAAPIASVITNGGKATTLYKRLLFPQTHIAAHALPSTSPANASWSFERLLSVWKPALEAALE